MHGKLFVIGLVLLCLSGNAVAQVQEEKIETLETSGVDKSYSRAQVLSFTGLSTAFSVLTVTGIGFVDPADLAAFRLPWWLYATMGAEHLPLYLLNSPLAPAYTIAEAGLLGLHLGTLKSPFITEIAMNSYAMTGFYSTYEIYKETRLNSAPGIYPESWESYGLGELFTASFALENLMHPAFYIPVGISTALNILSSLDSETAIWKTGKAYIEGNEYPLSVAIPLVIGRNILQFTVTAIGEEALYRGVIYEELKVSLDPLLAKACDMIIFPLIHVGSDLARGRPLGELFMRFGIRAASTLLFDIAYDLGGLPLSTAIHTWFNTVSFSLRWAASSGVDSSAPEGDTVSLTANPPISLSVFWVKSPGVDEPLRALPAVKFSFAF